MRVWSWRARLSLQTQQKGGTVPRNLYELTVVPSPEISMNSLMMATAMLLMQWVNVPLPKTPRQPNGKPNLSAPVPKTRDRKPDLTGIWRVADGKYLQNIAADGAQVPFQPWAEALYKERQANNSKDWPSGRCLP